jgi:hypothetical protein
MPGPSDGTIAKSVPLPTLGGPAAGDAWESFRRRRDALVDRMEMRACDGCDGCGGRCTDGVTVTRQEWDAVRAFLDAAPEEEVARVLSQQKVVPWPGADEEAGATVTLCRFRDTERNNCFVYPARPTICRLFGHTPWLPCPIGKVERVPDGSPALWGDYRTFERRTFAEWAARDGRGEP